MAYGKSMPDSMEKRMVDLGRSDNSLALSALRRLCIEAKTLYVDSMWPASLLDGLPEGKDFDAAMLAVQSTLKGKLNSVWAEKCRLQASYSLKEQLKRGRGVLFGKLKHIDAVGENPLKDGTRRLLNLPEEWSSKLSDEDAKAIVGIVKTMNMVGIVELLTKARNGCSTCLTEIQIGAVLALLSMVEQRFGCPVFGADDAVVQLHIDFRCMPGGRTTQNATLEVLTGAIAAGGRFPILVSGVKARDTPLHFMADVQPTVVARLAGTSSEPSRFTSLVLEIGPKTTVLRGVLSQQPKPMALADAKHLLGDDFGCVNTCAWSVVPVDRPLDVAFFKEAAAWTRKQAKDYLETHSHDGVAVMEVLHSGRSFLSAINAHALHVDALRKQIDLRYERFHRIKHEVCRILAIPDGERLDFAMDAGNDKRLGRLLAKLALLLKQIAKLKSLRRSVYRTVAGMKKSWFGWLSNRKVELARRFNAACVREDLTILAIEKKSSGYKGRTMNRMLNNGSKGQYLRANSSKLKWNGIPELTVPSYFTSVTDVRHAVVDKKQRNGEVFTARVDGMKFHADLRASLNIALYSLLRRKLALPPEPSMDVAVLAA